MLGMRILHSISSMNPSDGGPPMALSRLAGAQAELGAKVTIAAIDPNLSESSMQLAYQHVQGFESVTLQSLPSQGLIDRIWAYQAGQQLEALIKQHDVLHIHGIWRPHLLQAALIAQHHGKPYVVSPHGMLSIWSLSQKRTKKKLALWWKWRRVLDEAAFVHVLNHDEAEAVQRVCQPRSLVREPNGISEAEITRSCDQQTVWQRYPYLHNEHYIIFVGRLHYSKGLDILVDAFFRVHQRLPDTKLVILGPDFGEGPRLQNQLRALGLTSCVHVLGGVYGDEKLTLLRHAQCFCLPSRQEGFSMAIIEAMALGLPVVISQSCHFPEVAKAGAGEVVPLHAESVANSLLRILRDSRLAATLGGTASELARTKYQWNSIATNFLGAYASIARHGMTQSCKTAA